LAFSRSLALRLAAVSPIVFADAFNSDEGAAMSSLTRFSFGLSFEHAAMKKQVIGNTYFRIALLLRKWPDRDELA
jgi:hypothetical protein